MLRVATLPARPLAQTRDVRVSAQPHWPAPVTQTKGAAPADGDWTGRGRGTGARRGRGGAGGRGESAGSGESRTGGGGATRAGRAHAREVGEEVRGSGGEGAARGVLREDPGAGRSRGGAPPRGRSRAPLEGGGRGARGARGPLRLAPLPPRGSCPHRGGRCCLVFPRTPRPSPRLGRTWEGGNQRRGGSAHARTCSRTAAQRRDAPLAGLGAPLRVCRPRGPSALPRSGRRRGPWR